MRCSNTKKKYYRRMIMFFSLTKNRKSIRKYKKQEIEKERGMKNCIYQQLREVLIVL